MRGLFTTTGKLKVLDRLANSRNGNPRFLIMIGDCVCSTPVDSSYGYSITNHEGKQVSAEIGIHYGISTLNTIKEA